MLKRSHSHYHKTASLMIIKAPADNVSVKHKVKIIIFQVKIVRSKQKKALVSLVTEKFTDM